MNITTNDLRRVFGIITINFINWKMDLTLLVLNRLNGYSKKKTRLHGKTLITISSAIRDVPGQLHTIRTPLVFRAKM